MTTNGATVNDSRVTFGGPLPGRSFFHRQMLTANTNSPMTMQLCSSGTSGVPVAPGEAFTLSIYGRKDPGGGPTLRAAAQWFDAAGVSLSTVQGSSTSPGIDWVRYETPFVAPVNAAFVQVRAQWSGIALVNQLLDLGAAQFERGALTSYTDNRTLEPAAVIDYATRRESRSMVLEPLGSKYPTVFLREAQSRSGTLSLLFLGDSVSREAEAFLSSPARFTFEESAVGESWDFVVVGAITRTRQAGTSYWVVSAEVREVRP